MIIVGVSTPRMAPPLHHSRGCLRRRRTQGRLRKGGLLLLLLERRQLRRRLGSLQGRMQNEFGRDAGARQGLSQSHRLASTRLIQRDRGQSHPLHEMQSIVFGFSVPTEVQSNRCRGIKGRQISEAIYISSSSSCCKRRIVGWVENPVGCGGGGSGRWGGV